jgi:hypothetical protein
MSQLALVQQPQYCQYSSGFCDQSFEGISSSELFFLYPSRPEIIARTIEEAIRLLRANTSDSIKSWRDMDITGRLVFCEVCKNQRYSRIAVTDVTTLNFNVMFEIGFALGLGVAVLPIRDVSYASDHKSFDELGLLDTFGYLDFANSGQLADKIQAALPVTKAVFTRGHELNQEQPVYVIKSPIATEGQVKLLSALKKSGLRFRTFDPKETSRLSLPEAVKQVRTALGVVAHLLAPQRIGALVHNARCAFAAGLAMASGKYVLMLQEGDEQQPVDYRDVVQSYTDPAEVQPYFTPFVKQLYEAIQSSRFVPITLPLRPLETIDFGDIAAENEINALKAYFVPTAQYNETKRGHARLVVGRKGAGKTAIFYAVRNAYWATDSQFVLDLKPEGHQFTKLRELVLKPLSLGMQEHVLTAFWNYLLLMELANKIIDNDRRVASPSRDPARAVLFQKIVELYGAEPDVEQGDFSERLLALVDRITESRSSLERLAETKDVTQLVYERDIRALNETLSEYLKRKDGVWLLFDNLDKGWPVNGAQAEDILLLRSLLEATRKLQRQLARKQVECRAVVFIRNDIYEHLLHLTPDKGKDTAVVLDWTDTEAFRQIVHRRITLSTGLKQSFDQLWPVFFDTHVKGEESFSYLLRRTLMRPRDLLRFLRQCVNVAVNRGRDKVLESDILQAETAYSEDQLQEVSFELRDVSPDYPDVLYAFIGSRCTLTKKEVEEKLLTAAVPSSEINKLFELLLFLGFLGALSMNNDELYAYQYEYGVQRMLKDAPSTPLFIIHPAFRFALGIED